MDNLIVQASIHLRDDTPITYNKSLQSHWINVGDSGNCAAIFPTYESAQSLIEALQRYMLAIDEKEYNGCQPLGLADGTIWCNVHGQNASLCDEVDDGDMAYRFLKNPLAID